MEKEKPYKCEVCGKRYKNLNGLKYVRDQPVPASGLMLTFASINNTLLLATQISSSTATWLQQA